MFYITDKRWKVFYPRMSAILNAATPNTASYRSDQLPWTERKGTLKVKSQLHNPIQHTLVMVALPSEVTTRELSCAVDYSATVVKYISFEWKLNTLTSLLISSLKLKFLCLLYRHYHAVYCILVVVYTLTPSEAPICHSPNLGVSLLAKWALTS